MPYTIVMLLCILFCILGWLFVAQAQQVVIKFAPLPIKPREEVIAEHVPLVRALEKKTGYKIEIVYEPDYRKLFEEFMKGNIDMFTSGPVPYVDLKRKYKDARAIVFFKEKEGTVAFSCVMITAQEGLNKIEQIKGPIALPQKIATCGYFSASIILSSRGKSIEKLKQVYYMTHNEVAEAVIRGECQVGMLRKDTAMKYTGYGIKVLAESQKWPNFAATVNTKTLSPEVVERLKKAFLSINPETDKDLIVGKYGFAEAREEDFEEVKKYAKHIPKW